MSTLSLVTKEGLSGKEHRPLFCGHSEWSPAMRCCSYYGSYQDARNNNCYKTVARIMCFPISRCLCTGPTGANMCTSIGKALCSPFACLACVLTCGECLNPWTLPFFRNSCQNCPCCQTTALSKVEVLEVRGIKHEAY